MMIIDDEIMLVGSANLNDRSMLGYRDSELAVVITDDYKVRSKMNGALHLTSELAHKTRSKCFQAIFGLPEAAVIDPLDEAMWEQISFITKVY